MHLSRNIQKPLPSKESKEIAPKKPVGNKNLQQSGVAEKRGSTAVQNAHAQASPALAKGSTSRTKRVGFSDKVDECTYVPDKREYVPHSPNLRETELKSPLPAYVQEKKLADNFNQSPSQIGENKADMPPEISMSDSATELQDNTKHIPTLISQPAVAPTQLGENKADMPPETSMSDSATELQDNTKHIPTLISQPAVVPTQLDLTGHFTAQKKAAEKGLDDMLAKLVLQKDLCKLSADFETLQKMESSQRIPLLKRQLADIFKAYMRTEFDYSIDSKKLLLLARDLREKEIISPIELKLLRNIAKLMESTSQPSSAGSVIAAREEAALKKLDEVIEQGLRDVNLRNDLYELPAFLQGLQEQGESYTEIVASLKVKFARIFVAYMPKEFGGSIDSEKLLLLAGDLKKKETISQVNFQHIGSIAKFMKNTEFKNKMAITAGVNKLAKLYHKIDTQGSDVATSQESLKIEIMNFLAEIRPNVPKSMSLVYDNPGDLQMIAGRLRNQGLVSKDEYDLLGEVAKFMKKPPSVEATAPMKPTAPVGGSSVPSAPPLTADEFAILNILKYGNSAGPSRFNGIKKVPDYGAAQRIALNKGSAVALRNFIAKLPPKIGPTELAAAAKSLYQRGEITNKLTANALITLANERGYSKPLYVPVSLIE